MATRRQYPHVDGIAEWQTQQTVRLLWDRVFAVQELLAALNGQVGDLASQLTRLEDAVTLADRKADEALAQAQRTSTEKETDAGDPAVDLPLLAPNEMDEIQATMDAHPEIDPMDESTRGAIIDITAWRLNGGVDTGPWGRKARSDNPAAPNLNTDAMTYKRADGLHEIYDVISGVDGSATWGPSGPYNPGDNGYWWPAPAPPA